MASSGNMGHMASDAFDAIPLEPEEQLDSDEIRNAFGPLSASTANPA